MSMARMTPSELARQVGTGLLSFPVTCFKDDLSFDEAKCRDHVAWLGGHKVAGLFAAGGTGEFFSLALDEVESVVRAAVAEPPGACR
jgi:5-dehydro-4-deoxyglucarate dehydratase